MKDDDDLTTKEAAQIIAERDGRSMTAGQVVREIKKKKIKGKLIGHTYILKRKDVDDYKRRHPGPVGKQNKLDPAKKNLLIQKISEFGLKMRAIGKLDTLDELEPSSARKKDIKEMESEADSLKRKIEEIF